MIDAPPGADDATTDADRVGRIERGGLDAMASALGLGSPIVSARRLRGGMASSTHEVRLANGVRLVVKRYPVGDSAPQREHDRLRFAYRASLPVPEPLGVDRGAWFGVPAVVMRRLPGRADLRPRAVDAYVAQVAEAMARVHEVATGVVPSAFGSSGTTGWEAPDAPPSGVLPPTLLDDVVTTLGTHASAFCTDRPVFTHGDLHPGNLVWTRGRLRGLVDWSHATAGDRWSEVSYFRVELAMLVDVETSTALADAYAREVGERPTDDVVATWDLFHAYNAHRWVARWLPGYRAQGRRDLELDDLRRGLTRFVRRALEVLR